LEEVSLPAEIKFRGRKDYIKPGAKNDHY
jgi:hypothetical protein